MSDFTKLRVWETSHQLTVKTYKLTAKLPREEVFGLVNQLRRAAVSVESNLAEGESRYTTKDKINFFIQSRSSAAEVQTQLFVIEDIYPKLASEAKELKEEYDSIGKQINSLIRFRRSLTYAKTQ